MTHKEFMERKNYLDVQIKQIKKLIQKLPEGNFFCCQDKNSFKWYYRKKKKQIYIPKKNQSLAEQLAYKKYLTLRLEDLQQELKAVDAYLQYAVKENAEQLLEVLFVRNPRF